MKTILDKATAWFDASRYETEAAEGVDWLRIIPFIGLHLACLGVIWVGVSWVAVAVAVLSYGLRMFAITAFYHRYFSHKSFRTGRLWQFCFAVAGATATQRGPLWWAAHHRAHHRTADTEDDPHSPRHGFWWSHIGWFLSRRHFATDLQAIPDLARYPELRFLDRFDVVVPILYAAALWLLGDWLATARPGWGTSGAQMLVWGYFLSTVVLVHVTVMINSVAHKVGRRRYETRDTSRNNWWLALLTLGEGWHNNHHHFPGSARQGFYWWEVDVSFYGLKLMQWLGVIRDMKTVPLRWREQHRSHPPRSLENEADAA